MRFFTAIVAICGMIYFGNGMLDNAKDKMAKYREGTTIRAKGI